MQNLWPNGVISKRETRLQDISARKAISQLETLEKRAIIIILFFNLLFTVVIFMKVDNISSHC